MTIVHICLTGVYTEGWTYQENLLSKYHSKMGHDVVLIASTLTYDNSGRKCTTSKSAYKNQDGVFVIRLKEKKDNPDRKFRRFPKLYDTLTNINPDILFVHKMEDVLLWVQTGNAVAITSNRTIEKQNAHVVLREIQMEEARGHDVAMAWHKSNYNPAIALFMEMLEQHCRRQDSSAAAGSNEKEQEFG